MSKRSSQFQLTKDFDREQEDGPTDAPAETPVMATAEVMATRKIAGRGRFKSDNGSSGANPFATFKGKPSTPQPSLGMGQAGDDSVAKRIALNKKFAETVQRYLEANPAGDWTSACDKYVQYQKKLPQVKEDSAPAPVFGAKPKTPLAASKSEEPVKYTPPTNFTFGHAAKTPSQGQIKYQPPANFTFGGKQPEAKKPEEPKPFAFGQQKTEQKDEPKPFAFGQQKADEPKPFAFGQAKTESEPKPFSFGQSAPATEASTPKEDESKLEAPKFSFNQSQPFSFNKDTTEKPAFSFGSSEPKPFNFGQKPAESAKTFSFGATESKPSFSFGQAAQSNGFTFGANSASGSNGASNTWQPSEKQAEAGDDDEEEQKDEQQQDLAQKNAGEESESSVLEIRTKLYDAQNEVAGLGPLRVLVHKESKKSRVVMRAEGSGRVLLNTVLPKEITYSSTKQYVTIPAFGSGAPVPYKVRVKTEQDAQNLADKLNEVKA